MDNFTKLRDEHFYVNKAYLKDIDSMGLNSLSSVKQFSKTEKLNKAGLAKFRERSKFTFGNPEYEVYLKKYFYTPSKSQIKNWLEHKSIKTTAEYDILHCDELKKVNVNTADVIAYGFSKKYGFEDFSFAMIRGIDQAKPLDKDFPVFKNLQDKKAFIKKLAVFAKNFHKTGLRHRDFYLCHIFYSEAKDKLTLIDLQRIFRPILTSKRYKLKDLAQLYYSASSDIASKADRLRFYKIYTDKNTLSFKDKIFINLINKKARKMLRHDIKKKRIGGYAL